MRVFVAGANGAVGRRLVPMLVARGHQVTGTTTSEKSARGDPSDSAPSRSSSMGSMPSGSARRWPEPSRMPSSTR